MVRNYRCKPAKWEEGLVTRVSAGFDKGGKYYVTYDVLLERTTEGRSKMYPDGGAPIFLYVGDDGIEPINETP